jgi:glycosyltransferase involved in cell wall biosynthesis
MASEREVTGWADYAICVVIPCYNEERHIAAVISQLPSWVRHIVVVDDCSRDRSAEVVEQLAKEDSRVVLVRHERNQGVGGAMISGFQAAIELGAQVVVKMDGDGQMSPDDLPRLIEPLLRGQADFAKGNRFQDFSALARMPLLRRAGNMGLSFLTKAAVGYWNCFDPCNGFVAIRGEVLAALDPRKLQRSFFFETSLLANLYLLGAVIRDVPMPARYGDEKSHLSITRVLIEFPPKLFRCFLKRILLRNFVYEFSMESVYLLAGMPLFFSGVIFGAIKWYQFMRLGVPAPTGTVVIPTLLIILGFQLLLSAIGEDLRAVPRDPLCSNPITKRPTAPLAGQRRLPADDHSA